MVPAGVAYASACFQAAQEARKRFPGFPNLIFLGMRSVITREDGLLGFHTPLIGGCYQGHEVTPEQ